ncbi:MAG TPA: diguanylate cyclase [Gammaproteobacteria bacterium]
MRPEPEQILIVEDSRTYAELLRRRISQQLEFGVLVATTLAQARELVAAHRERIFAAVLDLNLPDAQHGEIVDLIVGEKICAIVLTSTLDEPVRQQVIDKNIADYVVKQSLHDIDYILQLLQRIARNREVEVMVVDDSPTYRHVLRHHLQPYKYRVLEAGNGREALALLAEHPEIRLVLTDTKMPEMDGFELTTELRKTHSKEQLAIIGLSAESGGRLSARFLKRGANDFLVKPFSKEEFFCRVNQNIELIDLVREISERTSRDYLTGLYNRHYFFELGDKYFENARRHQLGLSVAVVDIDHFKSVNERFGHAAGDRVIRRVAGLLAENLRRTDVIARFGSEEFAVLAVNAGDHDLETFERLRRAVEEMTLQHAGQPIKVSVSIGLTRVLGDDLMGMVQQAEALMRQAKQQGRNRLVHDDGPAA